MQLFSNANRERIKADNPGASFGDMGKLLAQAWKAATAEERAPFEAAHAVRRSCSRPLLTWHGAPHNTCPIPTFL